MMHSIPQTAKRAFLGLISVVVIVSGLYGCSEEQEPEKVIRPIRAMEIPDSNQFAKRSFPGRAKATQEVDLAFRVAGPLIEFPVDVGDEVKQGQVVARIDPRDYNVRVQQAQGKLDNARAEFRRAENDYQRELSIKQQDPGATSQTAVDRKREERDRARANIKLFDAQLDSVKDDLNYTYLKAPFDGNIVEKYVENYEDVLEKQPIVRILDDSQIEMVVNVPESLISIVPQVKNITVVFDPFPEVKIPAIVKEIGKEASSTTRTYPVNLIMQQPDNVTILPGMAGKATGEPPKGTVGSVRGIEIPVSAVFPDEAGEKSFVWLVNKDSMTVTKHEIKIGRASDHGVLIREGLKPGDHIATAGVTSLREGQEITILKNSME